VVSGLGFYLRSDRKRELQALSYFGGKASKTEKTSAAPSSAAAVDRSEEPGSKRADGLPEFSAEEVAKKGSGGPGGKVWVTYGHGVYDVTNFIVTHPGKQILTLMFTTFIP